MCIKTKEEMRAPLWSSEAEGISMISILAAEFFL